MCLTCYERNSPARKHARHTVLLGRTLPEPLVSVPLKRADTRLRYGGSWFAAASALPLTGGFLQPGRAASLLAAVLMRPQHALAFILLLARTKSERVALSRSCTGRVLSAYLDERSWGLVPRNRFCRGVLLLPEHHAEYVRGRHRQALRTNLRRAEAAGIRCETISDASRAFDDLTEINKHRRMQLTGAELPVPPSWREMLARPEMTLFVSRDRSQRPLAITAAVIDESVCLIRVAVANTHEARWALHDYVVQILIGRGVKYLFVDGGGPFGALGLSAGARYYQHLLGYELRHLRPLTSRRLAADAV